MTDRVEEFCTCPVSGFGYGIAHTDECFVARAKAFAEPRIREELLDLVISMCPDHLAGEESSEEIEGAREQETWNAALDAACALLADRRQIACTWVMRDTLGDIEDKIRALRCPQQETKTK